MEKLLGGQIALDDFIFAHVKGETTQVKVMKSEPALGLTITDNGAGLAFIKRIKENSITDKDMGIHVGDHIESINGENVVGCRHYDVARKLRDVPVDSEIVFGLVKPLKAFGMYGSHKYNSCRSNFAVHIIMKIFSDQNTCQSYGTKHLSSKLLME